MNRTDKYKAVADALRALAPRVRELSYATFAGEMLHHADKIDELFALEPERRQAREIINRLCVDPEMWGTHGMPNETKLARLESEIAEAIATARTARF